MRHLNVTSKAIRSIGYDEDRRHLEVEFHNGRRYRLEGVSAGNHSRFINADSVGDFFNKEVKGKYKTVELTALKDSKAKDEEPTE